MERLGSLDQLSRCLHPAIELGKKKKLRYKLTMTEKLIIFIGSKKFSAFVTGLVLLLIIPLIIQFAQIASSDIEGREKVEALVKDQENIALILIGIGTFLGGRRILLKWLEEMVNPDIQLADSNTRECQIYGFYLILLGSFMEVLDQLILHIESLIDIGVILELCLNFPLDLLSAFILARLFLLLSFGKKGAKPVQSTQT